LTLVLLYLSKLMHPGDLVANKPASSDELENVYLQWSSILGVGHYCWLHGPICRLPPNN
jgi:hypothetical protein